MNNLNDYDYNLPEELIAKEPLQQRDASRLFVFNRKSGKVDHCTIGDLLELLHPGDCLVLNDTQGLPLPSKRRGQSTRATELRYSGYAV